MRVLRWFATLWLIGWLGCAPASPHATTGTGTSSPSDAGTQPTPLRKVRLALNWFPEAEHGGFYAAERYNYYLDEGIQIEILPGGKSPVLPSVAAGQVEFCVDNADKLLLARSQQADVVAVLAPIQDSPRCIMVHADSGIETFEQLAAQTDFTLAMNPGQPFAQFLSKRLDLSKLRVAPYPGNVSQFLLNRKFAQQAYSFSEPFVAEQQGADVRNLMVSDLGFNTYTSLLIVGGDLLRKEPELVDKMIRASARGWRKYLESPAETNALIHQRNPEMPLDVLDFGVRDLRPLCLPEGFTELMFGTMTPDRWQALHDQMVEAGSLQPGQVTVTEAYRLIEEPINLDPPAP